VFRKRVWSRSTDHAGNCRVYPAGFDASELYGSAVWCPELDELLSHVALTHGGLGAFRGADCKGLNWVSRNLGRK